MGWLCCARRLELLRAVHVGACCCLLLYAACACRCDAAALAVVERVADTSLLLCSCQAVFYFVWGLSVTSWTFYFSSLWEEARPAVLLSVIWIIISG